jgi:predicted ATPase/DNA-binding winged helix-turn-helix (wHTH) protein
MDDTEEYLFGPFRLILRRLELFRDDVPMPLGSRNVELLGALIEANGTLVTKQALLARVWPREVHGDSTVWVAIAAVRKALGVAPGGEQYIVSVPNRGYRFTAPVTRVATRAETPVPSVESVAAPAQTLPGNLAHVVFPLIGREDEIACCLTLMEQSKLLTITGPGGVGKTRVALALGDAARDRHADGVWLVELAALATAELVPETIAAMLGLSVQGGRTPTEVVATYLRQKDALLILDNCEHVVTEAARLADAILENCPRVRILATSREPLRVSGEQIYPLPSLAVPDQVDGLTAERALTHAAVRLFEARACLAVEDFALDDAVAPIVASICRRLDGIPLAIELAAPRLRALTLRELLDRLDQRFGLLTGGSRAVLPRHQTLKALIDWSWDHLSEAERILLGRLAVFGGSFTMASAEAVTGAEPLAAAQILDLIAGLVDKSLVMALPAGTGARRYLLLETIRQYAAERLAESGDGTTARRLADHLCTHFEAATRSWPTTPDIDWLAVYEPDFDNLRAALRWAFILGGDSGIGLRLVSYTGDVFLLLSLLSERLRWFELAEAQLDATTPPDVHGRILSALAQSNSFGQLGQRSNVAAALEAAALFRTLNDPSWLGRALGIAGSAHMRPGDVAAAEPILLEAEAVLRPLGSTKLLVQVLGTLGSLRYLAGQIPEARALTEEALELGRRLGARHQVQIALCNLAEHYLAQGQLDAAIAQGREAVASCQASGSLMVLNIALRNLSGYLLRAGDLVAGRATAQEGIRLSQSLGNGMTVAMCLENLALAAALGGDAALAARLVGYSDAFYQRIGFTRQDNEQEERETVAARLESELDGETRARLIAEGAAWSEETAVAAALGE